jgi:hypothetical protein
MTGFPATVYRPWRAVQAYRAAEATAPERARTPHELGIHIVIGTGGFPINELILHGFLKPVGSYPTYIPVGARRYYLDETMIPPRRSPREAVLDGLALLGSAVCLLVIVWGLLSLMD